MNKKLHIIMGAALIIAGVVVGILFSVRGTGSATGNARRATTDNLKLLVGALREYQEREGKLPETLSEVDIADRMKLDGNGRPFELAHRKVAADRPGHGHYVIVGMTKPVKDGLFSKPWWYAIVQEYPDGGRLEIRSGCGDEGRQSLAAELEL